MEALFRAEEMILLFGVTSITTFAPTAFVERNVYAYGVERNSGATTIFTMNYFHHIVWLWSLHCFHAISDTLSTIGAFFAA